MLTVCIRIITLASILAVAAADRNCWMEEREREVPYNHRQKRRVSSGELNFEIELMEEPDVPYNHRHKRRVSFGDFDFEIKRCPTSDGTSRDSDSLLFIVTPTGDTGGYRYSSRHPNSRYWNRVQGRMKAMLWLRLYCKNRQESSYHKRSL
jgi:hypothetical protein